MRHFPHHCASCFYLGSDTSHDFYICGAKPGAKIEHPVTLVMRYAPEEGYNSVMATKKIADEFLDIQKRYMFLGVTTQEYIWITQARILVQRVFASSLSRGIKYQDDDAPVVSACSPCSVFDNVSRPVMYHEGFHESGIQHFGG